jgi:hypothetical protein
MPKKSGSFTKKDRIDAFEKKHGRQSPELADYSAALIHATLQQIRELFCLSDSVVTQSLDGSRRGRSLTEFRRARRTFG